MCTRSKEALSLIAADPFTYDLVITDMTMPEMQGERLCASIREIRKDLPLLLFTGIGDTLSPGELASMGFAGMVRKPARHTEVAIKIREILDQKTSR
jgi:DNA-binding response OmpR family regulator